MKKPSNVPCLSSIFIIDLLLIISIFHLECNHVASSIQLSPRQTYIVHVRSTPSNATMSRKQWHESFLPITSPPALLTSFQHVMSGFAAMLSEDEVEAMSKKEGFLHAHPSRNVHMDTTYTPRFLGLEAGDNSFWKSRGGYGKGVIIGMIDSGISPTHPSFNDDGMPPPPARWKGKCEFSSKNLCNNKLIGARSFHLNSINGSSSTTPMDGDGHGTHTSSTASGRFVGNASVLWSAYGTTSGIAPDSYLAIYKVCRKNVCADVDMLAGMDSAVEDGVDVISASLGSNERPLYDDTLSKASFNAVKKGVFVSASAGNDGPFSFTLSNSSPWIFTVGASTIDRNIRAVVKLGNGVRLEGQSSYQPTNFTSSFLPLIHPQSPMDENATYCSNVTTLIAIGVQGKVVVCEGGFVDRMEIGLNVKEAGGVAVIHINPSYLGFHTDAQADVFPTSGINYQDGMHIINDYMIKFSSNPIATIEFLGTQIGGSHNYYSEPAPAVASFSSRGPSKITPGFVKPDVISPGVNILAAWPKTVGAFPVNPPFNIMSGTSMACPHVSGIAALLKSAHPDWSPAMIKSAIVTTSEVTTNSNGKSIVDQYDHSEASFHAMGSGHVNPIKAYDPGLVYDDIHSQQDYISYLCGLGYTDKQVSIFVENSSCSNVNKVFKGLDLNYPSMVVLLTKLNNYSRSFSRVLTNVGPYYSYNLTMSPPSGVNLTIVPNTLCFKSIGEQLSFTVSVTLDNQSSAYYSFVEESGYFAWVSYDGMIKVRSPLVVSKS